MTSLYEYEQIAQEFNNAIEEFNSALPIVMSRINDDLGHDRASMIGLLLADHMSASSGLGRIMVEFARFGFVVASRHVLADLLSREENWSKPLDYQI